MDVIGTLDELNAQIGICLTHPGPLGVLATLSWLQSVIFDIGSELACPPESKFGLESIGLEEVNRLEAEIDSMTEALPPLKNFILPGGTTLAAQLHLARAVCRRLERAIVVLSTSSFVRNEPLIFINRLSDWIFCSCRMVNAEAGVAETLWNKREK